MATFLTPLGDGIKQPTIEQPSRLFNLPRELRDIIYEYVFTGFHPLRSINLILCPLFTCRQFYFEARRIAFGSVTFRFVWGDIAYKYFDGNLDHYFDKFKENSQISLTARENYFFGMAGGQSLLSSRPPGDFNISAIAQHAGLSTDHLRGLRRISVICFSQGSHQYEELLYHFLENLGGVIQADLQLDLLTISLSWGRRSFQDMFYRFAPTIRALWGARATKRIVLANRHNPSPNWFGWVVKRHMGAVIKSVPRESRVSLADIERRDAYKRAVELSDSKMNWHWKAHRSPDDWHMFNEVEITWLEVK